MPLNPFSDDCALPIVYIETNAETLADGTANDGRYVDDSAVGERESKVDGLADGQRHRRLKLHSTDGKIAAFG